LADPDPPGASPVQYFKPFTYFVGKKPGGFQNLLLTTVCVLIPIVGAMVLLGYRAEVAEDLDKDPNLENYPDFTFDRFMEYLQRGVWPFVVQLIVGLSFAAVMMVPIGIAVALAIANNQPLIALAGYAIVIPFMPLVMMVTMPMELHAQLTGRFAFGQECRFMTRFLGKVWGQALLASLAYWFFAVLLGLCGYLLLCVGVYFVAALLSMAQQHYTAQLYRLYLAEGGEPIGGPSDQMDDDEA
jgi:hypothetical protein